EKESGCRPSGCNDDSGEMRCGYFQITQDYYQACGQPGKKASDTVETAWRRCAEYYTCSSTCVQAYVAKYKSNCPDKDACEQMARIHNGGPQGCSSSQTTPYWINVAQCVRLNQCNSIMSP
ncbi:hypothetical protein PENTCL1PPCAC_15051, partial [Pristionchus entomophagus]